MEKQKVILVDDKKSYRDTLKNILNIVGHCDIIAEASNGHEYLELLNKHTPDITFMDIEMPVMNGIVATEKALEINKELKIIGLSMYDNNDYIEQMVAAGARGYLLKLSNNTDVFRSILNNPEADDFFSEKIIARRKNKKFDKKTKNTTQKIKRILIVDDFETNTVVMSSALMTAGYSVYRAASAEHAFKIIRKEDKIDLIVTDFNMPGEDGADLISRLKKIKGYADTPMLILSSDNNLAKKDKARKAGAAGWIKKPFKLEKFLKIVDMVMKKS